MTSNIEAIREAEAQIPIYLEEIKRLREEALADDGVVDEQEQKEIDRVEIRLVDAEKFIAERRAIWEQNKSAYEALLARVEPGLQEVREWTNADVAKDKQTILDIADAMQNAASVQDFAEAKKQAEALKPRVENFLKLTAQLAENARLEMMTPDELAKESLIEGRAEDIFTEDYMQDLIKTEFPTESPPEEAEENRKSLSKLMNELESTLSGKKREEAIAELAKLVGEPPTAADLDADYSRFLILREQQETIGVAKGHGEVPDVDEERHPEFQGSRGQLLFGKALGDAFGIHEVFGALLSPTGGLVGPGNDFLPMEGWVDAFHTAPDNPIGLHGTMHDAGGYLKAYHNEGPGYNYRESMLEDGFEWALGFLPDSMEGSAMPLVGQGSGILYWCMEVGPDFAEREIDDLLLYLEDELTDARDECAQQIGNLIVGFEQAKQEASAYASDLADDIAETVEETEEDLIQLVEDIGETVSDTVDDVGNAVGDAVDLVEEQLQAAGTELGNMADYAEAEAMNALTALEDAAESAAECAVETFEDLSDGVEYMADAASETLGAIGSFIWG